MIPESPYDAGSEGDDPAEQRNPVLEFHLSSPMKFWLVLIFVAMTVRIVISENATIQYASLLLALANIILLMPGILVIPILVALLNGIDIGNVSTTLNKAHRASVYNGIYTSVIYIVAIVVVYELFNYVSAALLPATNFIIQYWVVQPVIILIVLPVVMATVAFYRKKSIGDAKKKS